MSEAARIAALKAALEFRSGTSTPESVVALAREFELYINGGDSQQAPATQTGTLSLNRRR